MQLAVPDAAPLRIPPHVYACGVAGGAVVIDLQRNRYIGLDMRGAAALLSLAHTPPEAVSQMSAQVRALIPSLVHAGLIEHAEAAPRYFAPERIDLLADLKSIDELGVSPMRVRPQDAVRIAYHGLWVRRALRSMSLFDIACQLRNQKQQLAHAGPRLKRLAGLVSRFVRLRPYTFAARERCLFHALTLTRFLLAHGEPVTWVIGVRTHPWAAHSWVQVDRWLLDASPEQIREYVPLIAV